MQKNSKTVTLCFDGFFFSIFSVLFWHLLVCVLEEVLVTLTMSLHGYLQPQLEFFCMLLSWIWFLNLILAMLTLTLQKNKITSPKWQNCAFKYVFSRKNSYFWLWIRCNFFSFSGFRHDLRWHHYVINSPVWTRYEEYFPNW